MTVLFFQIIVGGLESNKNYFLRTTLFGDRRYDRKSVFSITRKRHTILN